MTTRVGVIVIIGVLLGMPILSNLLLGGFSSENGILLVSLLFLIVLITTSAGVIASILENILDATLRNVQPTASSPVVEMTEQQ
jgi:hypothetical protein